MSERTHFYDDNDGRSHRIEDARDPSVRLGDWISTHSGQPFWPLDPRIEDVRIIDIAHALSHLCRFAGHTNRFYSVAQHSVIVSEICGDGPIGLWGLLHDASEAYLNDITRPLKHSRELSGYRVIEASVQRAVCQRFGLEPSEPDLVKHVDALVLRAEQRDLMTMPADWRMQGDAHPLRIDPQVPTVAKRAFLGRFHDLADAMGLER
jgi:hypothetical protein